MRTLGATQATSGIAVESWNRGIGPADKLEFRANPIAPRRRSKPMPAAVLTLPLAVPRRFPIRWRSVRRPFAGRCARGRHIAPARGTPLPCFPILKGRKRSAGSPLTISGTCPVNGRGTVELAQFQEVYERANDRRLPLGRWTSIKIGREGQPPESCQTAGYRVQEYCGAWSVHVHGMLWAVASDGDGQATRV